MRTYKTMQGDTWDIIAYKMYGDERLMSKLINANPEVADIVIFSAGTIVYLVDEPVNTPQSLPPWKSDL